MEKIEMNGFGLLCVGNVVATPGFESRGVVVRLSDRDDRVKVEWLPGSKEWGSTYERPASLLLVGTSL